jgi:hypothetical protein
MDGQVPFDEAQKQGCSCLPCAKQHLLAENVVRLLQKQGTFGLATLFRSPICEQR